MPLAVGGRALLSTSRRTLELQFEKELHRWGPQATSTQAVSQTDAEAYCRRLARRHYENFPLASWMLPRKLHQHFYNIYAYCRWADDLGDETADRAQALSLLAWWRDQLAACYEGLASHPVFVALRGTIEQYSIPREPFADLISAFEQDQRVTEYETFDQLRDYCRRSADPVGRLVLYLCECYSERNVAWSDSICTGLQLANFWQDVARDHEMGRIYIPRETRQRFGYRDADLRNRVTNSEFLEVMRYEVDRARGFLQSGLPLVEALPGRIRVDIDLFAQGGLCILERIEGIRYCVWQTRPTVTKADFAAIFFRAMGRNLLRNFRRRMPISV